MDCARFGLNLARQDGILTKLITPIEAPVPHAYFQRVAPHIDDKTNLMVLLVAPQSLDAFLAFTRREGGRGLSAGTAHLLEIRRNHTRRTLPVEKRDWRAGDKLHARIVKTDRSVRERIQHDIADPV